MTNTKTYYLVNNLETELSLINGYINIAPKSFAKLRPSEVAEQSVEYALSRRWAEISETEPEAKQSAPEVKIETVDPFKGLTFEELQAEQASKAAEKEVVETVEKEVPEETAPKAKYNKTKKAE